VTLYTKPGCSLCDKAKALLGSAKLEYREVNVLEDDALRERYQYEIPVLVGADGRELIKGVFSESRVAALIARGVV
jgi:glutaredoxin